MLSLFVVLLPLPVHAQPVNDGGGAAKETINAITVQGTFCKTCPYHINNKFLSPFNNDEHEMPFW